MSISVQVLSKHTLRLNDVTSRTKPCENTQFLPRAAQGGGSHLLPGVAAALRAQRVNRRTRRFPWHQSRRYVTTTRNRGTPEVLTDPDARRQEHRALAASGCLKFPVHSVIVTELDRPRISLCGECPVAWTGHKATVGRVAVPTPGCVAKK